MTTIRTRSARLTGVMAALAMVATACPPNTPNGLEHRIRAGETARDVHVFVLGDSWSVHAAAPDQLEATKDYVEGSTHHVGVQHGSDNGPLGNSGRWGYAAEWLDDAVLGGSDAEVVEVSNFSLGGSSVRGWLHPDGPCSGNAELTPAITDGCYQQRAGSGATMTVPAFAPSYYRLSNVVSQLAAVPADTVPVVYLSLGAGDLAFHSEKLEIDDPAARTARLAEIEAELAQLIGQLRGAHPRAEIIIAGYANFAAGNALTGLPADPGSSVFDFGDCDTFFLDVNKRTRMINALMNGFGPEFDCFEHGDPTSQNADDVAGLDGVYRRLDRDLDLAHADDRVHFSSSDHPEQHHNWTMFSFADTADSDKPSPSCVMRPLPDRFHLLITQVAPGCSNPRGQMNPAKTFGIEVVCDWRYIAAAFD